MAVALYKQYYAQMLEQNAELFDQFRTVHDAYAINPEANKERFNEVGKEVLNLMQRTESRLCARSEGSGFGRYSTNLSEKFRGLCKEEFPKIGMVGIS